MLKPKYAKFVEIYSMCPVINTVTYVGSIGYENRSILLKNTTCHKGCVSRLGQ